ncbi:MAG TPA: sigma-70 family RNA polymerase sigma factor [Chthoniobacterales bacterium]|nr:sigma-70 family RNA polymerase sigma factor [Chthoniobacterales bacterium]
MSVAPTFFSHQFKFLPRQPRASLKKHKVRNGNSMSSPTNREQLASSNGAAHEDLICQAMNDDPKAQAQLFTAHRAQLYRKAYSILRNREDAEDALQDCWLRALTKLNSFGGRSSFSTWLTRIVINCALMILRKKRILRERSLGTLDDSLEVSLAWQVPSGSPNPEESLAEYEEKKILDQAICGLRPRIRQAVELGQLHELSTRETGLALGISMAAAKGRLFHARAALRKSTALRSIASSRTQKPSGSWQLSVHRQQGCENNEND